MDYILAESKGGVDQYDVLRAGFGVDGNMTPDDARSDRTMR